MTTAARIIPLPAAQMKLQRARNTIRDEGATDADLLAACKILQRAGDWMDYDTAEHLRRAVLERNGWHAPRPHRPARQTLLAAAALALAALLAGAILAEWQITERIAATVAQAEVQTW